MSMKRRICWKVDLGGPQFCVLFIGICFYTSDKVSIHLMMRLADYRSYAITWVVLLDGSVVGSGSSDTLVSYG